LGKNTTVVFIGTALYDFTVSYGVTNGLFIDRVFWKVGRRFLLIWFTTVGVVPYKLTTQVHVVPERLSFAKKVSGEFRI
jgi:hypothetical protein